MTFRLRDMHYERGEVHARHAHDEAEISILLRGSMREGVRGVTYAGSAGNVIVKPAGVMHDDAFDGARILCLDTPPFAVDLREYEPGIARRR